MKRALCAILFATLVTSSSQAGYVVGQVNLSTGSGADGSLGVTGSGSTATLVGTNLLAPSVTASPNGTPPSLTPGPTIPLTGNYFDFSTGNFQNVDGNGVTHYAAGGNFFITTALVSSMMSGNPPPPMASSITAGPATVTSLGNGQFELNMSFTGGYLSPSFASDFNQTFVPLPQGRLYTGTVDFIFVSNNALAGNQLLSGSITFNSIPEPSSIAMLLIGGVGFLGYGGRRLVKRAA